jgi:hypothetical protein
MEAHAGAPVEAAVFRARGFASKALSTGFHCLGSDRWSDKMPRTVVVAPKNVSTALALAEIVCRSSIAHRS